jgi:hypothetical protein
MFLLNVSCLMPERAVPKTFLSLHHDRRATCPPGGGQAPTIIGFFSFTFLHVSFLSLPVIPAGFSDAG